MMVDVSIFYRLFSCKIRFSLRNNDTIMYSKKSFVIFSNINLITQNILFCEKLKTNYISRLYKHNNSNKMSNFKYNNLINFIICPLEKQTIRLL